MGGINGGEWRGGGGCGRKNKRHSFSSNVSGRSIGVERKGKETLLPGRDRILERKKKKKGLYRTSGGDLCEVFQVTRGREQGLENFFTRAQIRISAKSRRVPPLSLQPRVVKEATDQAVAEKREGNQNCVVKKRILIRES